MKHPEIGNSMPYKTFITSFYRIVSLLLLLAGLGACRQSENSVPTPVDQETPESDHEGTQIPPVSSLPVTMTPARSYDMEAVADLSIGFIATARPDENNDFELIEIFNNIARPDDILLFPRHTLERNVDAHLEAIRRVQTGRVVQMFPSWQMAEEYAPLIRDDVDCLFYDLEKWDQSVAEWQDIAASSQKMAQIAAENGLCYIGMLSGSLANDVENDPAAVENMARYSYMFNIQWFGILERTPTEYSDYVISLSERARNVNENVLISMGVTVANDGAGNQPETLFPLIIEVADYIDLVGIFNNTRDPASTARLVELITLMRPTIE